MEVNVLQIFTEAQYISTELTSTNSTGNFNKIYLMC